jgi:hypothetical protein
VAGGVGRIPVSRGCKRKEVAGWADGRAARAHLLPRANHANDWSVGSHPQLLHDLLQLRVRARGVHDARQLPRVGHLLAVGRLSSRHSVSPRFVDLVLAPAERGAEQAESLPSASRALQERMLAALQCEHYLLHVQQLQLIRLKRKLNRHAGDVVSGHDGARMKRSPLLGGA